MTCSNALKFILNSIAQRDNKQKAIHSKKWQKLCEGREASKPSVVNRDNTKLVVNLSKNELTNEQISVLS
jgi:hypothetical protein